jgi:hypothetical protein
MRSAVLAAALLLASPGLSLAQALAPLPSPDLPPGSRPSEYLRAAQGAIVAGHRGEGEQALEMAETRILDRSVPLGQVRNVDDNPTVTAIHQARDALRAGNRDAALQSIQAAISSATTQGM